MNRLLTTHEAAALCQLHVETIRELARAGALPGAVRIGRRWRIDAAALLEGAA